jgi:hypothetical protein
MKQFLHDRWIESRVWLILWVAGLRQLLESIRLEANLKRSEFTLLAEFTAVMLPDVISHVLQASVHKFQPLSCPATLPASQSKYEFVYLIT